MVARRTRQHAAEPTRVGVFCDDETSFNAVRGERIVVVVHRLFHRAYIRVHLPQQPTTGRGVRVLPE